MSRSIMSIVESRACQIVASLLLAACTTTEVGPPIKLGLVEPDDDEGDPYAGGNARIAQLAVDAINKQGGINGRTLELDIKEEDGDPEIAASRIPELVADGAVGAIGWGYSSFARVAYPIARDHAFPIMSPSSTAPSLSSVDDGGYLFRALPNDAVQSVAMAYYMTAVAKPALTDVAVVYETGPYGEGLADAFRDALTSAGGTITGRVEYESGVPGTSTEAAEAVMEAVTQLPRRPQLIVLVAGDTVDGAEILKSWTRRPGWSDVRWFFTDGMRASSFLTDLPSECVGMLGTAPTFPTLGDSYSVLRDAYAAQYPQRQLDQESYAPNVWDSVYLFAAALVAQDAAGEELGGAGLRDRLTEVSKGPGLILHAGQWRDIIGTLRRGNDIDYDGASGPFDLDANGEAVGPYEVWKIVPNGATTMFEQALFIDAKQIAHLRGQ